MSKEFEGVNRAAGPGSKNLGAFLAAMWPQCAPAEIDRLAANYPPVFTEALNSLTTDYVKDQAARRGFNKAKQLKPGAEILRRWLAGQPIPEIAAALGKQEGSVELTLDRLAKNLSGRIGPFELAERVGVKVLARIRQLGQTAAAEVLSTEVVSEVCDEPAVLPEESASEAIIPRLEPDQESIIVSGPLPEPELTAMPKSEPNYLDTPEFPLAGRLSPQSRASLDEMMRQAGITRPAKNPHKPDQYRQH